MAVAFVLVLVNTAALAQTPWIAAAQEAVRAKLRDSSSAEFSELTMQLRALHAGGITIVVCGKVVARKVLGGMSAPIPFVYVHESGNVYLANREIALIDGNPTMIEAMNTSLCGRSR